MIKFLEQGELYWWLKECWQSMLITRCYRVELESNVGTVFDILRDSDAKERAGEKVT